MPQDNAAAERGIGELKAESGLGKGVKLPAVQEAALCLAKARHLLDNRPRPSKGYKSAVQLEKAMLKGPAVVDREEFYSEACRGMRKAVQGGGTRREKRQRQRLAVYEALEKFRLIRFKNNNQLGRKSSLTNQGKSEDIL